MPVSVTPQGQPRPKRVPMDRVVHRLNIFDLKIGRDARAMTGKAVKKGHKPKDEWDYGTIEAATEDTPRDKLYDELFTDLFSDEPLDSAKSDDATLGAWAKNFYSRRDEVPDWQSLVTQVVGDPGLASMAADAFLDAMQVTFPDKSGNLPRIPEVDYRNTIRRAVDSAKEAIRSIVESQEEGGPSGYGRTIGGKRPMTPADFAAAKRFADQLATNPKLRRVMDMAGKFRAVMSSKYKKKVSQVIPEEVTNIEQGADFGRLLPSTMLRLITKGKLTPEQEQARRQDVATLVASGMPTVDAEKAWANKNLKPKKNLARLSFFKDFTEKQLLQYEMTGTEEVGKGPVVFVADKSGSMKDPGDDSPWMQEPGKDTWATALAIASYEQACNEKRAFVYVPFHQAVNPRTVIVSHAGDAFSLDVVARMVEKPYDGDDVSLALKYAIDMIEKENFLKGASDVILTSDGYSDFELADEIKAMAAAQKTRIMAIALGANKTAWGSEETMSGLVENLLHWTDEVYPIPFFDQVDEDVIDGILGTGKTQFREKEKLEEKAKKEKLGGGY